MHHLLGIRSGRTGHFNPIHGCFNPIHGRGAILPAINTAPLFHYLIPLVAHPSLGPHLSRSFRRPAPWTHPRPVSTAIRPPAAVPAALRRTDVLRQGTEAHPELLWCPGPFPQPTPWRSLAARHFERGQLQAADAVQPGRRPGNFSSSYLGEQQGARSRRVLPMRADCTLG
ncbi:hypothetical protein NDU88_004051 [Pleurodeles waltl]|uniref:Uncharacterized protein n=1 Tax=Pleurodeles waltl TaxID=8319 RepID=A0AAV7NJY4_PLEWA|nr:hypothetical protein NDU88_004051 [Pleurodeles waltl]